MNDPTSRVGLLGPNRCLGRHWPARGQRLGKAGGRRGGPPVSSPCSPSSWPLLFGAQAYEAALFNSKAAAVAWPGHNGASSCLNCSAAVQLKQRWRLKQLAGPPCQWQRACALHGGMRCIGSTTRQVGGTPPAATVDRGANLEAALGRLSRPNSSSGSSIQLVQPALQDDGRRRPARARRWCADAARRCAAGGHSMT